MLYGKYSTKEWARDKYSTKPKAKCYISSLDHSLGAIFSMQHEHGSALTGLKNLLVWAGVHAWNYSKLTKEPQNNRFHPGLLSDIHWRPSRVLFVWFWGTSSPSNCLCCHNFQIGCRVTQFRSATYSAATTTVVTNIVLFRYIALWLRI